MSNLKSITDKIEKILDEVRTEFHGDWAYDHFPKDAVDTLEHIKEEISKLDSMKMYIWDDLGYDYEAMPACALANSVEEARRLVSEGLSDDPRCVFKLKNEEPDVYDSPAAFSWWFSC